MTILDETVSKVAESLEQQRADLAILAPILVNRDLNGRVRLIVREELRDNPQARESLGVLSQALSLSLERHGFPAERMVLFETDLGAIRNEAPHFRLEGFEDVWVLDRLATESDWSRLIPPGHGVSRIVFFSIKGGVGRSTSLAAAAWALAEAGKRVLVLDMDLESPGLSSSLLPEDRRPRFGLTDWLVEDLVDNGVELIGDMIATSDLSHNGEIYVVPAYGSDPGEYIAKLGRVWMPKMGADGTREPWAKRLQRLLTGLENRLQPDVILIDSRSGIDDVASTCVTDLGASAILLFALEDEQTWSGYRILFRHWHRTGVVREIRERLQVVGAMIPDVDGKEYFADLRESSWSAFSDELYDEVPPGCPATETEYWNFDQMDESGPHYPWPIHWHRGFAAMRSLHQRMSQIDSGQINQVFGDFFTGIEMLAQRDGDDE